MKPGADGQIIKNTDDTYHIEPITVLPKTAATLERIRYIITLIILVGLMGAAEYYLGGLTWYIHNIKWVYGSIFRAIIFGIPTILIITMFYMSIKLSFKGVKASDDPLLVADLTISRAKEIRKNIYLLDDYSIEVLKKDLGNR